MILDQIFCLASANGYLLHQNWHVLFERWPIGFFNCCVDAVAGRTTSETTTRANERHRDGIFPSGKDLSLRKKNDTLITTKIDLTH